jgi:glycosyltransferase involved in cell wall biosynthesis
VRVHWHFMGELRRMVKTLRPDHVYVMYGDGLWQLMQLRRMLGGKMFPKGTTSSVYLVHGGIGYPTARSWKRRLQRWLFRRMIVSGPFDEVFLLDELMEAYARRQFDGQGRRHKAAFYLSPLPVAGGERTTPREARRRMGLEGRGQWIVMTGMIGRLRGVDRIVAGFLHYLQRRPDDSARLLLAGPQDEWTRAYLASEPLAELVRRGRIKLIDHYLNDQEMYGYSACGDLMVVGTHNHTGRSSAILWAAAAGRPVVTTNTGCIGYVVERNGLGRTCDVADPAALAEAMDRALSGPWTQEDIDRVTTYARFHSLENYRRVGTTLLRRRVGPAATAL